MAATTPPPAAAFVAGWVKPEEEEEAVARPKEEEAAAAQDDAPAAPPPYPTPTAALPPCPRRKRAAPAPEGAPGVGAVDRRKSKVWHYYSKLGDAFVECRVCRKQLSFHNSTTTMREHLVRKHGIRDTQPPEDAGAPPEPAGKRARPAADAGCGPAAAAERSEVIAELVLEMVFRDLRPLAAVEDGGFGQLLAFLEPGLALPAPARLAGMLGRRYGAVRRQVERYLQAAPSVVVCAEAWAAQPDRPYVTLTATFVDGEWRRARCALATRPVPREGGWARELGAVLAKFGLSGQRVSWVLQGEGGGGGGGGAGWGEPGCAAGALQRCVGAGLEVEQVRDALSVARGIVGYFQRDAEAAGCLQSKLEAINKTKVKLAPDAARRWLTTAEMCENLLELKWAVLSALEERPKAVQSLAEHQWRLLQELVPVLRTLKLATAFLSEEQNVSASALLPCVHGVAAAIGQQAEGAGAAIKAVVGTIRAELARCWGLAAAAEEEALLENPAVVAAFLDPRFKELRFLSPGLRVELHRRVKAMLSQGSHPPAAAPAPLWGSEPQPRAEGDPPKESRSPQSVYDVLLGKDPTEDMPEIHQQLENYVVEPLCKRSTDPLHWWKSNERRFPAVAQLGRRYLALPATAVPPERAFATGQSMLEQRRAGLAPENLDQILFLHQNSDFWEAPRGGPEARGRNLR